MVVWLRPNYVDAVIRMKHLADLPVRVLAGCTLADLQCKAMGPYAPEVVEFLTTWSKRLFARPDIRSYPDAGSFAYWCRPANLAKLQRELGHDSLRLGRGLALHIAPANVPVNFAYSFAFGLLAGNANIVRVPESLPAQADALCVVANELLSEAKFGRIASMNTLISYPREDAITQRLSAVADVRLLWGGDQTIQHLRRMTTSPRCVDIAFADRYSLCLMSAPAVLSADSQTLKSLSVGFYNDAFLLDQNACSSPHLVLWQGSAQEVEAAQKRLWGTIQTLLLSKEQLPGIHAVDKYTHLCRTAIQLEGVKVTPTSDNRVNRVFLDELPENIAEHRGRYGFFFESIDNDLAQLSRIVNARYQTLTFFGVDTHELAQMILAKRLPGIDRIVPVGKALDIGVIWDGYDLIRTMSRIIAIQ
jgi:hypothetical protein